MKQYKRETGGIRIAGMYTDAKEMAQAVLSWKTHSKIRYVVLEVAEENESIRELAERLGIGESFCGYRYLMDAVELTMEFREKAERITKLLYPEIAGRYQVKPTEVERAIRITIEKTWDHSDPILRKQIFGEAGAEGKKRPSNRKYILSLEEYLNGSA